MTIRLRLTLWYSIILAVTLFAAGMAVYFYLSHYFISTQKANMEQLSAEVTSQMTLTTLIIRGRQQLYVNLPPLDDFRYPGFLIQAVDNEGQISYLSNKRMPLPIPNNDEALEAAKLNKPFYRTEKMGSASLLILNTPINIGNVKLTKEEQFVGILQVAVRIDNINKTLNNLIYALALLALIIILAAASLGWFLARKALMPIDHVIAAADQIEKGADLNRRIEYRGPQDEIGRLTNTINNMLSRVQIMYMELEDTNLAQRRFVSDASHELRTPLTTIRGNVDLLEKMWRQVEEQQLEPTFADKELMQISLEAMSDISSESSRMSRLVNDLLSLARADAGYEMNKETLALQPLVENVFRKAQFLPRTADWIVGDLAALEQAHVFGNADYLQQLLFIFIENAFKYTPTGFVKIEAHRSGNQIGICIEDTGIGMEKDEVPHIFERFYRADLSRGQTLGTGLGLSIAQWIIDEHGGSIEVTTRKEVGSTFLIWLPLRFPTQLE